VKKLEKIRPCNIIGFGVIGIDPANQGPASVWWLTHPPPIPRFVTDWDTLVAQCG
jgi:hypothetical protein